MTLYSNTSVCWLKMGKGMNALETAQVCRILRPDWPKGCYREGTAHMFLKVRCNILFDFTSKLPLFALAKSFFYS